MTHQMEVENTKLSQEHEITQKILAQTINPVISNIIKNDESIHHYDLQCLTGDNNGFDLRSEIKEIIREYENPIQCRAEKVAEKATDVLLNFALNGINSYDTSRKYSCFDLPAKYEIYAIETILQVAGFDPEYNWHIIHDLAFQIRNSDKDLNTVKLETKNIRESMDLIKNNIAKNVIPVLSVPMNNVGELTSLAENGDVLQYAPDKYAGYYKRIEWYHDKQRIGLIKQGDEFESIRVSRLAVGLLNSMYFARKFIQKGLTTEAFLSEVAV